MVRVNARICSMLNQSYGVSPGWGGALGRPLVRAEDLAEGL